MLFFVKKVNRVTATKPKHERKCWDIKHINLHVFCALNKQGGLCIFVQPQLIIPKIEKKNHTSYMYVKGLVKLI